jgi:hypothetical protein
MSGTYPDGVNQRVFDEAHNELDEPPDEEPDEEPDGPPDDGNELDPDNLPF